MAWRKNVFKFGQFLLGFSASIVVLVMTVIAFYAKTIFPEKDLSYFMYLTITVLIFSLVIFLKGKSVALKSLGALIFTGWVWVITAPEFIPPFVPHQVKVILADKPVYAAVRKPFFVEEAIGRKINVIHGSQITQNLDKKNAIFFIRYEDYVNHNIVEKGKVLHEWQIWRRRTRVKQIINALSSNDITSLRQKYVLFQAN